MNKLPDDYQSNPKAIVEQTNSGGISVQKLLAGGETAVVWKENKEKEGESTLWITLTHSYPEQTAKAEGIKEIDRISGIDRTKLQEQHRTWWNTYYPASFLTLPEGIKENFYWIQMYKLASATRGDGALIDTTGPWLTETPWPNAWWNLNVQLTYWSLTASDRWELCRTRP
ncbi:hypothetical protein EZS27_035099 [termite gut metagenome]|uniref:Uncharacterized protein n=1 Tax=termite gut metagenome TaxID=433724 RepID=A0A5J4Q0Y4_9ZZZZ